MTISFLFIFLFLFLFFFVCGCVYDDGSGYDVVGGCVYDGGSGYDVVGGVFMMVVVVMMLLVVVFIVVVGVIMLLVVVFMMMLVVVDFFFISYIYKSSVYLKQCCIMAFDKKIATNSQNRLLSSAFKSLHCQKAFWVHVESRVLKRGSVVFQS